MKVIFSVYCNSGTQAMKLYYRIGKIQIKTILMMETTRNETEKQPTDKYPYIINVLTDLKKIDYMENAIKEKLYLDNILEHHEIMEI